MALRLITEELELLDAAGHVTVVRYRPGAE
jgi:hypothetical protein